MKKLLSVLIVLALVFAFATAVKADKPSDLKSSCTNIQSGLLVDTKGNEITMGFDEYGYNYQAHMFVGTYDSVDREWNNCPDGDPYSGDDSDPPHATCDDKLIMKWSDSWLANVDCDGDNKLDRGLLDYASDPTGTSMGWLTNHAEGEYDSAHYSYFVKIVWVGPEGDLWGEYKIIEKIINDPANGQTGLFYKDEAPPGFGLNDHWTTSPSI